MGQTGREGPDPVQRAAAEDEHGPGVRHGPRDPLPRRAHPRTRREREPGDPGVREGLGAEADRQDRPLDDPLHDGGGRDVRPDRDHRPWPHPSVRHAGEPPAGDSEGHDVPPRGGFPEVHLHVHGDAGREELLREERHLEQHDEPHVHPRGRVPGLGHPELDHGPGLEDPLPPEVRADPGGRLHPDGREEPGVSAPTATSRIPHRLKLNLQAIVGRAYPRIVGANREPSWIFFEAILPLLGIAAYVFIYKALSARVIEVIMTATPSAPFGMCGQLPCVDAAQQELYRTTALANSNALVASVVLGGTMVAFWLNVLWSMASQLYWEKEIGNLQLYMMAPMSRMGLLGGIAIGGVFINSGRAITTPLVGVGGFSVGLPVSDPLLLIGVFFVTLIALYGMGMMLASLYLLWGREAFNLSALLEEPIFFS